ncbi:MAG: nucleotide pyrophosphohydrolase [Armatimonadetes bacterium CG_4_10_14_3_um_filter_66_18]|nr:MAG: nucleotide pyrophosphohydrolase [Armatimonadetes bacterium CG_4_10_14_3_um_filter_66_18]
MAIREFQQLIEAIYFAKDSGRGVESTFMWFVEEVGELAEALRSGTVEQLEEEFADVAAWLATLASLKGIDLETAVRKYASGCPKCHATPCACAEPAPQP